MAENNTRKPLIVGGLLLAVILIVSIVVYFRTAGRETTDDAFIDAHIIPMSPKVAGQVTRVYVNDNQIVKQGDPLVDIDPRDYEARVAEQRGKVDAAEAEARRAESDAKRYEEVYKNDEISKQQLDDALAQAASSQATLEKERAALQEDELNLSYTKIVAPESGRVTRRAVEEGAYLQVGQTLLSIVPDQVYVTANFKETQLTHMRPGQKVAIRVDSYPGKEFEGHVDSIQSGTGERFSVMPPENATGNYVKVVQRIPVKIMIDTPPDPNYLLAPGMSVEPVVTVK